LVGLSKKREEVMADYTEEIAKRMAERKSRSRYWPHGEPGSRRERDRDRRKSDPSEMKASRDPKFKNARTEEPEKLESISEFVKKERTRRLERAMKAMEEKRSVPKDVPLKKWLSDPDNHRRAVKRGMVKKIAKRANPKSKDTDDVATVGGSRYAKTDLYKTPIREKASEIVLKSKFGSAMWWDRNKKAVFVASVSLVAAFMIYSSWKNAQLEKGLSKQRMRRHMQTIAHRAGLAGGHGGTGGGAAHGGGGGASGHSGISMQASHGQGGAVMQASHGQGHSGLLGHRGYGREGYGGEGWGSSGGWGGWGGWGDWNPWYADPYLDDASLWEAPYDSFDPYASWW
jgi:hypothetical protein